MMSAWYAEAEYRALINAVLLVGAASRISPGGGIKKLGTVNMFLVATVLLVWILAVADMAKPAELMDGSGLPTDEDQAKVARILEVVQLVCFGLWLLPVPDGRGCASEAGCGRNRHGSHPRGRDLPGAQRHSW